MFCEQPFQDVTIAKCLAGLSLQRTWLSITCNILHTPHLSCSQPADRRQCFEVFHCLFVCRVGNISYQQLIISHQFLFLTLSVVVENMKEINHIKVE